MTASKKVSMSKPKSGEPIPLATLEYFRGRHRRKQHSLVLSEFKKSGITQAELCKRLRKEPAQISRLLGSPANWSADTYSDLLFAISGAEPVYAVAYPLEKPARNYRAQEWSVGIQYTTVSAVSEIIEKQAGSQKFTVHAEAA